MRRFTRFYTNHPGLLTEGSLNSRFTMSEARVLYEIATRDGPTASDLARDLSLDPGYLSCILKRFEQQGLLRRAPSPRDGRQSPLRLTEKGCAAFRPLDEAFRRQAAARLDALPPQAAERLVAAMATVERLMSGPAGGPACPPKWASGHDRAADVGCAGGRVDAPPVAPRRHRLDRAAPGDPL